MGAEREPAKQASRRAAQLGKTPGAAPRRQGDVRGEVGNLEMQHSRKHGSGPAGSSSTRLRRNQMVAREDSSDEREADSVARQFGAGSVPDDVHVRGPRDGFLDPRLLGASAYAVGDNIVLAPGVDVETDEGAHILAHELAHVEQSRRTGDDIIRRYVTDDIVTMSVGAEYAKQLTDEGLDAAIAAGHNAMQTYPPDSIEYVVAEQNLQVIIAEVDRRGYKSPALGRQAIAALFPSVVAEMLDVLGLVRKLSSHYDDAIMLGGNTKHGPPAFLVEQLDWMSDALRAASDMHELSYESEPDVARSLIEQVGVRLTAVITGCHTVRAFLPMATFAAALMDDDPMRNPTPVAKYLRWSRERVDEIFAELRHLDWEGVNAAAAELPNVLYNLNLDLEGLEEAVQPMIKLPPSVQAGLVVLSVVLTRRSIRAGSGPKPPLGIGRGPAAALAGGSGAGAGVMGSISVSAAQLEAIRRLVQMGALSIAATAATATGFAQSYRVDDELPPELKDVLGEGPTVDAMRTTGKTGAGMARAPRHHVMPKEHRQWFKDRGIDIDDFTVKLSKADHEAIHGGGNWKLGRTWEGEWNKNIMTRLKDREAGLGRQLTRPEILKIVTTEMRTYGIPIDFIRYRSRWF